MALIVTLDTPKAERISRNLHLISGVIAFDAEYPTGGELLTDISKHFIRLLRLVCDQKDGYLFEFDKTNNKLKARVPVNAVAGSGTADANNTLMKSATSTVEVAGTGAAFQVAGAEVLDTTNLSGVTGVSFIAIGLK